ncbi:MAG: actin depolymerization factor/cofilin- and gelsolin-like domain-containing protein [Candidatus Helarchaeales archaeon]
MEVFEAFPDGELQFITQARVLKEVINKENLDKVFLILNHPEKEAWIWIGPKAQVQKKFACARASRRVVSERRLSYKIRTADGYGEEPEEFKKLLDCSLRSVLRKEGPPLEILKLQRYILKTPLPEGFRREACIIGNKMYVAIEKQALGQKSIAFEESDYVPNGVIDLPEEYRTRMFISHGIIQAIEFFVPENTIDKPKEEKDNLRKEPEKKAGENFEKEKNETKKSKDEKINDRV